MMENGWISIPNTLALKKNAGIGCGISSIGPVFVGDDWIVKKGPGRKRDVWRMKGVYTTGARRACHLQGGAGREINKMDESNWGKR